MAQCNFTLGDISGNTQQIIELSTQARDEFNADVVIFPELAITGYPPQDLLLRPKFHHTVEQALQQILTQIKDIIVVVGHPQQTEQGLYNTASVIHQGEIMLSYHKQILPNYSVFDEKRYFIPGNSPGIFKCGDVKIAVTICEDLWEAGPMQQAMQAGADCVLSLNASPFHFKKPQQRLQILQQRQIAEGKCPILYVNCVGGQDELVFDGASMALDANGQMLCRGPFYQSALIPVEFESPTSLLAGDVSADQQDNCSLYQALMLGTHDYIEKNGFNGVLVGLSGGIDSALTLAIAVDAIGADRVTAVRMPSRYTSQMSLIDADVLANNLGVSCHTIDIEPPFTAFLDVLDPIFKDHQPDVSEENIQARCRGIILMALSNKLGHMVLTTGNKSEYAVGYATLYGDMAGGFAVIKDVSKTQVYDLARYRNGLENVIPQRIIDRAPSAELAAEQTDQDSLPPYDILDPIIALYVEQDKSIENIIAAGFDEKTVRRVVSMIERNEYKRRQAPPGVRLSARAFGRDWRYPITSKFLESQAS